MSVVGLSSMRMRCGVNSLGGLFLLCAMLTSGCSPRTESWSTAHLARQIADADHAIASDSFRGSMLMVSGEEATKLIRAVSESKGIPTNITATTAPCCKVEFYRQTNLLSSILAQEEWFRPLDSPGEFTEGSGVLAALQRRLESDKQARQMWVNNWGRELLGKPGFASLGDWSLGLLQRYKAGEIKLGKHDDGPSGVLISYRELPSWLKVREVYIRKDPAGQPECVVLDWDYYGLVVSAANQSTTFKAWYTTNLAPGITAYHAGK